MIGGNKYKIGNNLDKNITNTANKSEGKRRMKT